MRALGFVQRIVQLLQQNVFPMAQVYCNVAAIGNCNSVPFLPLSSATRRIPDGTGIRNVAELSGENSLRTRVGKPAEA